MRQRNAVERGFARLRFFVLLRLIGEEASEEVSVGARTMLFDRVMMPI